MATRSPTEAHNYWGTYANPAALAALIGDPRLQAGDTAFSQSDALPYVFDGTAWNMVPALATSPTLAGQVPTWNGTAWVPAVAASTSGVSASFQGEVTGTTPTVIGGVWFPSALTLLSTSRVLAGVVGSDTATVRLVEQATSTVVATWTTAAALGDVTLGAPTALLASGWYVFDLAGSGAGTVTRCYGAFLEV